MANLGFLSEEQKKNIWGLTQNQTYIEPSVEADIPQNFAEVDDQPQLLSDIASSALDPNLKKWSDESYQIYQDAIKTYGVHGAKARPLIQWYENQALKYAKDYQSQYDNAMTSAVGNVLQKAKPKNTAEAYAALSSQITNPADYKKYVLPYLEMMGVGKETGQRRMYKGADGFNYWADTNERVNPDIQKAGAERKTIKGADGYQYFIDTGERVLPDVVKTSSTTGDKVPNEFEAISYLQKERERVANMDDGDAKTAAQANLAEMEKSHNLARWGDASGPRDKWAKLTTDYLYNSELIERMFEQMDNVNVTTGAVAGALGFAEGIASQVVQGTELGMAKIAGKDANDDQLRSSAHYDWGDAAELSGAFKANVTDLAYALARMAEPGGRLSTPDVQNQIDRIAPNGMMSKSAIAQALLEIDRGLYRRMSAAKTANLQVGYPVENFQMLRGRLMEGMATLKGPDGVERQYHILYDVDPTDPDKSTIRMKWMVD